MIIVDILQKNATYICLLHKKKLMPSIDYHTVVETVVELFRKAVTEIGDDVILALKKAYENEDNELAKNNLKMILENIEVARKSKIPVCQDTGIPVVFVELGRELHLDFDLKAAIVEGVRKATEEVPLRPNVVHPITRENTMDNVGLHVPHLNVDITDGDTLKLTVLPKGAGSENVSALKMLPPTKPNKITRFVIETVKEAGGMPCPPTIVGVGIGSTFDGAAKLAKKALLRENILEMNEFELELLEKINSLGIGPMGLGGKTTSLAVLVEMGHCHLASLPVAVNIQCWAHRRASAVLR